MKNFTYLIVAGLFTFIVQDIAAQQFPNSNLPKKALSVIVPAKNVERAPARCLTMEYMEEALRKDPSLAEKWRVEGERQYQLFLQRSQSGQENQRGQGTQANPIIIPIVFHLVDDATHQAWITDRDIYEQVEILNQDYAGEKITIT